MIQRYARKMHGRVFGEIILNVCASHAEISTLAPKYRLSPQYPFPCALQDLLASCMCCDTRLNPPAYD